MKFLNSYRTKQLSWIHVLSELKHFTKTSVLILSEDTFDLLEFDKTKINEKNLDSVLLNRNKDFPFEPISFIYAGHQFGHFVPVLGDGRAHMVSEVKNSKDQTLEIQLKGSGRTTFSRGGDGLSALGPAIREFLVSEFMSKLGVPTTKSLAVIQTHEMIERDHGLVPGGIVARVAQSHIRIGTFEYFANANDLENLNKLFLLSISKHYPELEQIKDKNELVMTFFENVCRKLSFTISKWMSLGFIHGVMNTDNMLICGDTIDYGPCAFMDFYKEREVYSYIDRHGRYAFSQQPEILIWNLYCLAQALWPLLENASENESNRFRIILRNSKEFFQIEFKKNILQKLGFSLKNISNKDFDSADFSILIDSWFLYLEKNKIDLTLAYRNLVRYLDGTSKVVSAPELAAFQDLFPVSLELDHFIQNWKKMLLCYCKNNDVVIENLKSANPIFIPRNHNIEKIIHDVYLGTDSTLKDFYNVIKNPFVWTEKFADFVIPPTQEQKIKNTFCGT